MIILMNSSKTMDYEQPAGIRKFTQPEFADDAKYLARTLSELTVSDFAKLMGVGEKLARLNFERYRNWQESPAPPYAKQALTAFKGDIYAAMNVEKYTIKDFNFAQKHLRILSGLYGILRPLDLIQPYRLEMATRLQTDRGKNMYDFWGNRVHQALAALIEKEKSGVLINLASLEYFRAVKADQLNATVITPVFKERTGSAYRVVAIYAKKARGRMGDFIIRNRITGSEDLKSFNLDGYRFNARLSLQTQWVFARASRNPGSS